MKYLILCHFNERMGPKIFFKAPETLPDSEIEQIPLLMDLYDEGFFMHIFGGFKSANYIFEIPSSSARGNAETLLVSILIPEGELSEDIAKDLLERFVTQFQSISDAYVGLHDDESDMYYQIQELFFGFYKSIPEETLVFKRRSKKILVFGLAKSGKAPLIEKLKEIIKKRTIPETDVDLNELLMDEVSIVKYEITDSQKLKEFWTPYLKDLDALIFMVDLSNPQTYTDAKTTLHQIANMSEMKELPILIIFNKGNKSVEEVMEINRILKISDLPQDDIKFFVATENYDYEIARAFAWLALKISERNPTPLDINFGVLFSLWNEPVGIELLGIHPKEYFTELQEIAIRFGNVAKSVFSEDKFKKSFFILPLTHLNMKAGIFTDYVEDTTTPEGKYPVMLSILFEDKIPAEIISRFNEDANRYLAMIKKYYSEGELVEKDLKNLYDTILDKLINLKGSVKDLITAEHRYQLLFSSARDAIALLDYKSGLIIDANKELEKIVNKPIEDIIGIHPTELMNQNTYEIFREAIMAQITGENQSPTILKLIFLNGMQMPVEIMANKVQVGGQNLIQCNFRDISERLKKEKRLKDSEAKNRALLNAIPDNILQINREGAILFFKPPMRFEDSMLPKNYKNKNIFDVIPKRIAQIIIDYIQRTLQTNKSQEFYFKIPVENVESKFEARMLPYGENDVLLISRVIYTKK